MPVAMQSARPDRIARGPLDPNPNGPVAARIASVRVTDREPGRGKGGKECQETPAFEEIRPLVSRWLPRPVSASYDRRKDKDFGRFRGVKRQCHAAPRTAAVTIARTSRGRRREVTPEHHLLSFRIRSMVGGEESLPNRGGSEAGSFLRQSSPVGALRLARPLLPQCHFSAGEDRFCFRVTECRPKLIGNREVVDFLGPGVAARVLWPPWLATAGAGTDQRQTALRTPTASGPSAQEGKPIRARVGCRFTVQMRTARPPRSSTTRLIPPENRLLVSQRLGLARNPAPKSRNDHAMLIRG